MLFKKNDNVQKQNFDNIIICLIFLDDILECFYGEVLKFEIINYWLYKLECDGLFCEWIFGFVKDYECYCGKYKCICYKGIVCDCCGVEVMEKKVWCECMGYIKLVVFVVYIWFFKFFFNKIGYFFGFLFKKLELIIYYECYVVIQFGIKGEVGIEVNQLLIEEEYLDILDILLVENQMLDEEDFNKFIVKMGVEVVCDMLMCLELDQLFYDFCYQVNMEISQQCKLEVFKCLCVVEVFCDVQICVENCLEWIII